MVSEIGQGGVDANRRQLGLHYRLYRPVRHAVAQRAVEDLSGHESDKISG
jgi:hypothetical protein